MENAAGRKTENPATGKAARKAVIAALVLLVALGISGGVALASADYRSETFGWYFAEGYTGDGFQEYLCLGNHGDEAATAQVSFLFNGGAKQDATYTVAAHSRLTVDVNGEVGAGREVSILVGSESRELAAERSMYFEYMGRWTGGHATFGATSLSTNWYFAEGYTGDGFDEYICVLNPGDEPSSLTFHFQTPEGSVDIGDGARVPPHSRATFKVNDLLGPGREASLELESDRPVLAERSMYFDYSSSGGHQWEGGHCVVGAPALSTRYYFAEGNTRPGFEEWLVMQNPGLSPVTIDAVYRFGPSQGEAVTRTYTVEAGHRHTVFVPAEVGPGKDVSVELSSTSEFLAERPLYFHLQRGDTSCEGGHCVMGGSPPAYEWFFPEGATLDGFEEWLTIQNCSGRDSVVEITYYTADAGPLSARRITVPANSRATVSVNEHAGPGLQLAAHLSVKEGPGIVAERIMYFHRHEWNGGHAVMPSPGPEALIGLCFSPYLTEDPTCGGSVSPERIAALLDTIAPYIRQVRTFCSTGDWVDVPLMAGERGLSVAAGCDLYTDRTYNDIEVTGLVHQARRGIVDLAVVGDETLCTGALTEDELISYIRRVKATGVPTTTSDSWDKLLEHPRVVSECDVVLVNIYPFWEGLDLSDSIEYLDSRYRLIKEAAGGKEVIVETGWPSGGDANGDAVPGPENAARYLADFMSWAEARGVDYFYFEAFDEPWKADREGSVGAHWGVWDNDGLLKESMKQVIDSDLP